MSNTSTIPQTCNHTGRNITIVVLLAVVASLATFVVVTALKADTLHAVGAAGGASMATFMAGLGVLQYMKHTV